MNIGKKSSKLPKGIVSLQFNFCYYSEDLKKHFCQTTHNDSMHNLRNTVITNVENTTEVTT